MIIIYIIRFLVGWVFSLIIFVFSLIYRAIVWDWSGGLNGDVIIDNILGEKTLNAMFFGEPNRET